MGLLDRLLGPPSLERCFEHAAGWLKDHGATEVTIDLEHRLIRYRRPNGAAATSYLDNLYRAYRGAKRAARETVLQKFLEAALISNGPAAEYADAKASLMPIVRHQSNGPLFELEMRTTQPDAGGASFAPVAKALSGDVSMSLVIDSADAMAHVTASMLEGWQVSFNQAMSDAIHNLRGLPEQSGWTDVGKGVWLGTWGDTYDSSRMLLPDLIHRLGLAQAVVMVPTRSTLLAASARDEAALAHLLTLAEHALNVDDRWLSTTLHRLDESTWSPFEPPEPLRAAWRDLKLRNQTLVYQNQKALLERLFEQDKTDVFVASYMAFKRPDGEVKTVATWTEGVEALLPVTDVVHFVPDVKSETLLQLDWTTVQREFGAFITTTDYLPTRVHVKGWPGTAAIERAVASATH